MDRLYVRRKEAKRGEVAALPVTSGISALSNQ